MCRDGGGWRGGWRRRRRRTRLREPRAKDRESSCSSCGVAPYYHCTEAILWLETARTSSRTQSCARSLLRSNPRIALTQEKLFKAIDDKKKAAAAAIRQQQEQEEQDAAEKTASRTKTNVYGDPVQVRPHINPRTKRLSPASQGVDFAGNYGQRLYQYGVTTSAR